MSLMAVVAAVVALSLSLTVGVLMQWRGHTACFGGSLMHGRSASSLAPNTAALFRSRAQAGAARRAQARRGGHRLS